MVGPRTPEPARRGRAALLGAFCLVLVGMGLSSAPLAGGSALVEAIPVRDGSSPLAGSSGGNDGLDGVSCTAASSCVAVGNDNATTLIESWNGVAWSVVPSPNAGTATAENLLRSVSCVQRHPSSTAVSCMAVGHFSAAPDAFDTLAEFWNGKTWSIVPSPNVGFNNSELNGVSCVSANRCVAVGDYWGAAGIDHTLIESWNGVAWAVVPSPSLAAERSLYGVSCLSANWCVAVGTHRTDISMSSRTLVEFLNGSHWTIGPSPDNTIADSVFDSVSCVSARSCQAVGSPDASWNGSIWTIARSPSKGTDRIYLNGVSCAPAGFCAAVASYDAPPATAGGAATGRTLAASWNRTGWSIVPSPNRGAHYNVLNSVSCASKSSCVGVGQFVNGTTARAAAPGFRTLIESWNGSTWAIEPSPNG
jgi:hypothetical protein